MLSSARNPSLHVCSWLSELGKVTHRAGRFHECVGEPDMVNMLDERCLEPAVLCPLLPGPEVLLGPNTPPLGVPPGLPPPHVGSGQESRDLYTTRLSMD